MKNLATLILIASSMLLASFSVSAQDAENTGGLTLRGRILSVELNRKDKNYVDGELKLSLDFVNESDKPIIILQPLGSEDEQRYIFWKADVALAKTKEDADAGKYVFSRLMLPSIYPFPVFRQLAERLNQPSPPADVTRILQPGATWTWQTVASFRLGRKAESYSENLGWEEISRIDSPLWVRVTYSIFPSNVERFRENLGAKLQRRWKNYGRLWFDRKSTHNTIISEPMMLNLRGIKVNDLVNGEPDINFEVQH